ncbi:hypothetical protein [Fibrella forsythiae]|uniref:Uncharacterized protein n=1 Tax=Fibrella forsythiae TaxID=2817061 RepID=A0ABS3JKP0_9BACT|nr:hypothetical protein [Fibrella forsythiae]MBO0950574.1 hypothetical protein [Fibrella forsythiae]
MDDQNKIEPDYVKGFNEGYLIAQHRPDLAEQLASIDSDFIRLVGFKAGREQYEAERVREERLPNWLTGNRSQKDNIAPTRSKDRDIEPDK